MILDSTQAHGISKVSIPSISLLILLFTIVSNSFTNEKFRMNCFFYFRKWTEFQWVPFSWVWARILECQCIHRSSVQLKQPILMQFAYNRQIVMHLHRFSAKVVVKQAPHPPPYKIHLNAILMQWAQAYGRYVIHWPHSLQLINRKMDTWAQIRCNHSAQSWIRCNHLMLTQDRPANNKQLHTIKLDSFYPFKRPTPLTPRTLIPTIKTILWASRNLVHQFSKDVEFNDLSK